jgi:hypothetical protein
MKNLVAAEVARLNFLGKRSIRASLPRLLQFFTAPERLRERTLSAGPPGSSPCIFVHGNHRTTQNVSRIAKLRRFQPVPAA